MDLFSRILNAFTRSERTNSIISNISDVDYANTTIIIYLVHRILRTASNPIFLAKYLSMAFTNFSTSFGFLSLYRGK